MKSVSPLFLLLLACAQADAPPPPRAAPESLLETTSRFEFHANFWLNMNHTLYKMASGEGRTPVAAEQLALLDGLEEDERERWDRAIAYYETHHVDDNIRTDDSLFTFKRWVIELPQDTTLTSDAFDPEWLAVLNAVAPVYAEHFWPAHSEHNRTTLERHLPVILEIEDPVFERLATLGRNDWPEGRIRVDVSYYANWAGAYTTNGPVTHVVISSADIQPPGNWLELLFHEPSHGIIGGWSPVGAAIDSAAAAHDVDPPSQLWHALLFYFSGRTVQEAAGGRGTDHQLYMIDKNVFSSMHPMLLQHAEPYVTGEISLEESLDRMMVQLPE